jgi:hypothetical protein
VCDLDPIILLHSKTSCFFDKQCLALVWPWWPRSKKSLLLSRKDRQCDMHSLPMVHVSSTQVAHASQRGLGLQETLLRVGMRKGMYCHSEHGCQGMSLCKNDMPIYLPQRHQLFGAPAVSHSWLTFWAKLDQLDLPLKKYRPYWFGVQELGGQVALGLGSPFHASELQKNLTLDKKRLTGSLGSSPGPSPTPQGWTSLYVLGFQTGHCGSVSIAWNKNLSR